MELSCSVTYKLSLSESQQARLSVMKPNIVATSIAVQIVVVVMLDTQEHFGPVHFFDINIFVYFKGLAIILTYIYIYI